MQDISANIHEDIKQWMLRRNYESLKEASEHLHKTLQRLEEGKIALKNTAASQSVATSAQKVKKNAAIRSLKHMKSQALATLVLRKNILKQMGNSQPSTPLSGEGSGETWKSVEQV